MLFPESLLIPSPCELHSKKKKIIIHSISGSELKDIQSIGLHSHTHVCADSVPFFVKGQQYSMLVFFFFFHCDLALSQAVLFPNYFGYIERI